MTLHVMMVMLFPESVTQRNPSTTTSSAPITVVSLGDANADTDLLEASTLSSGKLAPPSKSEKNEGRSLLSETYLPTSLLDESPQVIDDIPIDTPLLRNYPAEGKLILMLWIGEKGTVDKVSEEFSDLPTVISDEIKRNFYLATFRPGVVNGVSTKSRMRIEVVVSTQRAPGAVVERNLSEPLR